MDYEEVEVPIQDIVNFYIKINDSTKAKKDIAQLSSKDKLAAIEIIVRSGAQHEFKVDIANHFIYDLDNRVRRKAEVMLEHLVPSWVSDPAESILKLLRSSDDQGIAKRNAAVKFLFGIIDARSLRDTFATLLNSRNRTHMSEIIAILEEYIDSSADNREQVKIFDACLDIICSDWAGYDIKLHASSLLSVFFKKVESTQLGEALRQKAIEKQIERAESVYRFLCSGVLGLNRAFLDDMIRPLCHGDKHFQLRILQYFSHILERTRSNDEIDIILDLSHDNDQECWNLDEPSKENKIKAFRHRIMQGIFELWETTTDREVRRQIINIRFADYTDKLKLLEELQEKVQNETPTDINTENSAMMLRCFLLPGEDDALKLQAAHLLLFKAGGSENMLAALDYLKYYVENKNLNYAEKGSIAAAMETLMRQDDLDADVRKTAIYVLFITGPECFTSEEGQKEILNSLRVIVEEGSFSNPKAEERVMQSLVLFINHFAATEKLSKAAQYLQFKLNSRSTEPAKGKH